MRGVGAQLTQRLFQGYDPALLDQAPPPYPTPISEDEPDLGQRAAWAQEHGFFPAPQSLGIRFTAIPASKAPDTASIETAGIHSEAPAPTLALGRRLVWEDADLGARVWTTGSGGQEEMDTNSQEQKKKRISREQGR